jgi:hypothetical protein
MKTKGFKEDLRNEECYSDIVAQRKEESAAGKTRFNNQV